MSWWNKLSGSNRWLTIVFLFLCLSVGIVLTLTLLGPKIGGKFCTLADCFGDGIHIEFVDGNAPEKYSIEVEFPNGKRILECNNSSDLPLADWDSCKAYGAFFEQLDDLPPEEIVVTVIVDDTRISRSFHPEYEIWYPNGEDCPPLCYFATIEFELFP